MILAARFSNQHQAMVSKLRAYALSSTISGSLHFPMSHHICQYNHVCMVMLLSTLLLLGQLPQQACDFCKQLACTNRVWVLVLTNTNLKVADTIVNLKNGHCNVWRQKAYRALLCMRQ